MKPDILYGTVGFFFGLLVSFVLMIPARHGDGIYYEVWPNIAIVIGSVAVCITLFLICGRHFQRHRFSKYAPIVYGPLIGISSWIALYALIFFLPFLPDKTSNFIPSFLLRYLGESHWWLPTAIGLIIGGLISFYSTNHKKK